MSKERVRGLLRSAGDRFPFLGASYPWLRAHLDAGLLALGDDSRQLEAKLAPEVVMQEALLLEQQFDVLFAQAVLIDEDNTDTLKTLECLDSKGIWAVNVDLTKSDKGSTTDYSLQACSKSAEALGDTYTLTVHRNTDSSSLPMVQAHIGFVTENSNPKAIEEYISINDTQRAVDAVKSIFNSLIKDNKIP